MCPGNQNFCKEVQRLQTIITQEKKELLLITGAGVSLSAGIPLWAEIRNALYAMLFNIRDPLQVEKSILMSMLGGREIESGKLKYNYEQGKKWIEENLHVGGEKISNEDIEEIQQVAEQFRQRLETEQRPVLPPEFVMTFFLNRYGILETARFYSRFFSNYRPSPTYTSLIGLYKLNVWRYYLTFNMDYIMERELLANRIPCFSLNGREITHIEQLARVNLKDIANESAVIINMHGTYIHPYSLEISYKNILAGRSNERVLPEVAVKQTILELILSDERIGGIVIAGYSGNDQYFVNMLSYLLSNHKIPVFIVDPNPDGIANKLSQAQISTPVIKFKTTADAFFSYLRENIEDELRTSTTWTNIKIHKRCTDGNLRENVTCVAGRGSVIIAGDYGVYANGKMIQIAIPHKIYAYVTPIRHANSSKDEISIELLHPRYRTRYIISEGRTSIKDKTHYYYGFNLTNLVLGKSFSMVKNILEELRRLQQILVKAPNNAEAIKKIKKEITLAAGISESTGKLSKKNFSELEAKIEEKFIKPLIEDFQKLKKDLGIDFTETRFQIQLVMEYPPFQGLGDSLLPVIVGAIMFANQQIHIDLENLNPAYNSTITDTELLKTYFTLVKYLSWKLHYKNTSYLRPLGSFFRETEFSIIRRPSALDWMKDGPHPQTFSIEKYVKGDPEFLLRNLVDIELYELLSKCRVHVAVGRPASLEQAEKKYETQNEGDLGVLVGFMPRRLLIERIYKPETGTGAAVAEVTEEGIYETLAKLTDSIEHLLITAGDPNRLATFLTLYHTYMGHLKRSSVEFDRALSAIMQYPEILGGKVSGSGPAGGMVCLFRDHLPLEAISTLEEHGCAVLWVNKQKIQILRASTSHKS